jgi:hypothetical protein
MQEEGRAMQEEFKLLQEQVQKEEMQKVKTFHLLDTKTALSHMTK